MAKVTSKLQVTLPAALARQYRIKPGDEILWVAAGDTIRVVPQSKRARSDTNASRLRAFDQATARQQARDAQTRTVQTEDRGWLREDLYHRGRAR
jgi:bifunctional DNA-binding transcriptional regulator/antitoxin component of YhaV-PrlF toxin-antitoxin module